MKNENINITWLRAIACVMVVIIHVFAPWYYSAPTSILQAVSSMGMGFSRPSVPVFAMVSGYLLFSKTEEPSLNLAGKRFWSIFRILTYFGTIYYLYDTFRGQGNYPYATVFLKANSLPLWYLFTILPIYTLSTYITLPKGKSQGFYGGFLLIIFCLYFITESLRMAPFNIPNNYFLHQLFLYMIAGFVLGQIKVGRSWLFFTGYIIFSTIIFIMDWNTNIRKEIYFGYGTFLVFLQSLSFFMGMMRLNTDVILSKAWGRGGHAALSLVSKYSLGIYGWHIIFIYYSRLSWAGLYLPGRYALPLSFIGTFFCALLISMTDTWLWARVRSWLAALWQKISTRLQKT